MVATARVRSSAEPQIGMGSSQHRGTSVRVVTEVLIATDADAVHDEVEAALADESTTVRRVRAGTEVGPAVAASTPDLVILDLQIGNMGGVASCVYLQIGRASCRERVCPSV